MGSVCLLFGLDWFGLGLAVMGWGLTKERMDLKRARVVTLMLAMGVGMGREEGGRWW